MTKFPNIDSVTAILVDQVAERVANTFIESLPETERASIGPADWFQLEGDLFTEICHKIEAQLEVMRNKRIYQESYAKVQ